MSECGFCHGEPVGNAATWLDGKERPPAPCPRCGETNVPTPVTDERPPVPESGPPRKHRPKLQHGDAANAADFLGGYRGESGPPTTPVTDEMVEAARERLGWHPLDHRNDDLRAALEAALPLVPSERRVAQLEQGLQDVANSASDESYARLAAERRVGELEEALRKVLVRANPESVIADIARAALGDRSPQT